MPRFKDDAIVLRQTDWSETSQLVSLLTRTHGKVRGLAKGAKRLSPSSVERFSGGFEFCSLGEVIATTRRTTSLAQVTEWNLQEPFAKLRTDRRAWELAMFGVDIADAVLADEDPHEDAFELLERFLNQIGQSGSDEPGPVGPSTPETALLHYQWGLLRAAGYQPELDVDAGSGEALTSAGTYYFDSLAGGLVGEETGRSWKVRNATVELLRGLPAIDDTIDEASITRANRLLCAYLRAVLDRELPTMRYVLGTSASGASARGAN